MGALALSNYWEGAMNEFYDRKYRRFDLVEQQAVAIFVQTQQMIVNDRPIQLQVNFILWHKLDDSSVATIGMLTCVCFHLFLLINLVIK